MATTLKDAQEWGDGELLKIFMDIHTPVSVGIAESMPTLGEGPSRIGDNLEAMGAQCGNIEQGAHERLAKCAASRPQFVN
ncbi:hypothetical protein [Streptomyces sp. NPDC048650]|uniref:hypothetical protein n=1 Tax=Streptomyces sp. NPDC048650 TaxID=3365583 RepID=UPI0037227C1E